MIPRDPQLAYQLGCITGKLMSMARGTEGYCEVPAGANDYVVLRHDDGSYSVWHYSSNRRRRFSTVKGAARFILRNVTGWKPR